jgi:hypothetical protein
MGISLGALAKSSAYFTEAQVALFGYPSFERIHQEFRSTMRCAKSLDRAT